jgi:hypothetical protein
VISALIIAQNAGFVKGFFFFRKNLKKIAEPAAVCYTICNLSCFPVRGAGRKSRAHSRPPRFFGAAPIEF